MAKYFDAFEEFRKQQAQMKSLFNTPAMQMFREQQDQFREQQAQMKSLFNTPAMQMFRKQQKTFQNLINLNNSHLMENITKINNLKYPDLNKLMFHEVFSITKDLNYQGLFDDINLDDLSVIDEIIDEFKLDSEPDYKEDNSPDLVGNMTKNELRVEITQAIQDAQSGLSRDMDTKEKIRSYFAGIFTSIGQDVGKFIILAMAQSLFMLMINIAAGNHDYDVAKQVSTKVNENETVKTVKKAFVKNPEIERPFGDMGFLRTESKLRTRPSKKSHLASKEPISKNTVIFPVGKKGHWILVEVETTNGFYTGWIEESKVIKFKLEGKPVDK
ncbi:hypothetical protein [Peribacillus butanolivorans]|uniref:hypothetical protein n=1 Tax=Peribacillus butanolivorans TaxID=421767 RepID=UPI00366B2FAE